MSVMSETVEFRWRKPGQPWTAWHTCFHNMTSFGWVIEMLTGLTGNVDRVAWRRKEDHCAFEYRLKEQP